MRNRPNYLFHGKEIYPVLENEKLKVRKEIDGEDPERLLKVSEQDYVDYLVKKFHRGEHSDAVYI
jgi:hypothetical protein